MRAWRNCNKVELQDSNLRQRTCDVHSLISLIKMYRSSVACENMKINRLQICLLIKLRQMSDKRSQQERCDSISSIAEKIEFKNRLWFNDIETSTLTFCELPAIKYMLMSSSMSSYLILFYGPHDSICSWTSLHTQSDQLFYPICCMLPG